MRLAMPPFYNIPHLFRMIPGALFVSVDKLDGHVWTQEDSARFEIKCEQFLAAVSRLIADDAAQENA